MSDLSQRVVSKFLARQGGDPEVKAKIAKILELSKVGLHLLGEVQAWSSKFPAVLKAAEQEDHASLPPGQVWMWLFHQWHHEWNNISRKLTEVEEGIRNANRPSLPLRPNRDGTCPSSCATNLEYDISPYQLSESGLPFINEAHVKPLVSNPIRGRGFAASVELLLKWHEEYDKRITKAIYEVRQDMKTMAKLYKAF